MINPLAVQIQAIGDDERSLEGRVTSAESGQLAQDQHAAELEVRIDRLERWLRLTAWGLAMLAGAVGALVALHWS